MIVIIFFAALEIRFSIDDLFKVVLIEYFKTFTETVIYTLHVTYSCKYSEQVYIEYSEPTHNMQRESSYTLSKKCNAIKFLILDFLRH